MMVPDARTVRPGRERRRHFSPATFIIISEPDRRVHSEAEIRFEKLLTPVLFYAIKTQLKAPKAPFAVSLWHKGVYNKFFLCMEATHMP